MKTKEMINAHPSPVAYSQTLIECINACIECAQCCTSCADACIAGEKVEQMRHCIRTDLDCADVCTATAQVLSRQTQPSEVLVRSLLDACRTASRICGEECLKHADEHEHCKVCGRCCKTCEASCQKLLDAMK